MQQSKLCPPHRTQESDIPPDVEKQLPEFGFPVQSQSGVFLYTSFTVIELQSGSGGGGNGLNSTTADPRLKSMFILILSRIWNQTK